MIYHAEFKKLETKMPNTFHSQLPFTFSRIHACMFSGTLPIALDGTLPACFAIHYQVALHILSSTLLAMSKMTVPVPLKDSLLACLTYAPNDGAKDDPNCTRWHTPFLLHYMVPNML
jgi:hypothetical protein